MTDVAVIEYRKRRAERLAERGYRIKKNEYRTKDGTKVKKKKHVRLDAPDDEQKNNGNSKSGGDSGGGHGNTRLPFGLCQRFGIEIGADWGPKEAWDALAGKGITADGAYKRLKDGKDPGEPDKPKEPKTTVTRRGEEYYIDKIGYRSWDRMPYYLRVLSKDGNTDYEEFATKQDMYHYLKEQRVEEVSDPDTGELVNPSEMEFPKVLFLSDFPYRKIKSVTIGMRGGRYVVYGVGLDDKKVSLADCHSLDRAKKWLAEKGVTDDNDIKLSPALKKKEKERTAWMTSDKVEYVTDEYGTRYGDLHMASVDVVWGAPYVLLGSAEDGSSYVKRFKQRMEMMAFLKEQGVERFKLDGETVNPQEVEIPTTVAKADDKPMHRIYFWVAHDGTVFVYGEDLDGKESSLGFVKHNESIEDCKERIAKEKGFDKSVIETPPEAEEGVRKAQEEYEEKERRRQEFEKKAVTIGYEKFADLHIEMSEDSDGKPTFAVVGFDRYGDRRIAMYPDHMYNIRKFAEENGLSMDDLIKDDAIREKYNEFLEFEKSFEQRAVTIGTKKYADLEIKGEFDPYGEPRFEIIGEDIKQRRRSIKASANYKDMFDIVKGAGIEDPKQIMNEESLKILAKCEEVEKLVDSGEYHRYGDFFDVYKDIWIDDPEHGDPTVWGTTIDGETRQIRAFRYIGKVDNMIDKLENDGVTDYRIYRGGEYYQRPKDGMRSVTLMKTPDGFKIMATVEKGERRELVNATSEEEARKWLRDNGIDDKKVKTRGMNPNDDVPRTHTQRSLSNFDAYRMQRIEGTFLDNLSDEDKQLTAEMLTEVFAQGSLRVARSAKSFGSIIENGYKSQIETGTGGEGAFIGKGIRKNASETFFGHGKLNDDEYEKCGYLGCADEKEDWDDYGHPPYGGSNPMTYTLRKDRMEGRTTYTFGDSLNRESYISSAGYGGEKPTIEGMTALAAESGLRRVLEAYKAYKDGSITYEHMFKKIRAYANNDYIELQFHGPVTVEDIEKVSFKSARCLMQAFNHMSEARRKKVVKKLLDNNIKIECPLDGDGRFKDAWDWLRENYPSAFST